MNIDVSCFYIQKNVDTIKGLDLNMKIDAIILARGGSKGVPKKNIKDFCAKPLLAWTIEQCIKAKNVRNVWVSSDDNEILDIAQSYGAGLIRRPGNISGDKATSESGWLHAIDYLKEQDVLLDAILCPQVTSPLRESSDFDNAINKFNIDKLDSLFSASTTSDLFFWQENNQGLIESISYNYNDRKRRQDSKKQIIENGSFYLFKPEVLVKENNRFGGRIGYFEMEFWKMFEIDNFTDFRMCSAMMNEFLLRE